MFAKLVLVLLIVMSSGSILAQAPPLEPGVSQELARWRAAHYSEVRYKLNLTLEKMSPVLKGTMEIRLKVRESGSGGVKGSEPGAVATGFLPPIVLDWRKIKGFEERSTISNVSINGKAVVGSGMDDFIVKDGKQASVYIDDYEHLVFQDGVVAGENVIKLDFTSPILTSGSAITRYIDKEDGSEYIYSLFVPSDASTVFPAFDQPDLKARFELSIYKADSWKADIVSNSRLQTIVQHKIGWQSYLFEETKPISTYVFAFAAGPFEKFTDASNTGGNPSSSEGAQPDSRPNSRTLSTGRVSASTADLSSHIYVRKSQAKKFEPHAAEVFRLNREGIKFLEQYFDYKFPFPKYDIVLIPEFPFGGMEHAGATFLRESSVIFPSEPTANDYISRANVIVHEAAHQWFGDTVTMKWFDDLWLKEGFAEFMAYKTLEKVMPRYNAWKVFYERNKQAAYLTDSTKGTTPIYQPIANLSAAKSAYGNIVYRKAPSFLKQAEFYIGPDKFQTAVRAFLKKHEFRNAGWNDLVKEFQTAVWSTEGYPYWNEISRKKQNEIKERDYKLLSDWAKFWVTQKGVALIRVGLTEGHTERSEPVRSDGSWSSSAWMVPALGLTLSKPFEESDWALNIMTLYRYGAENEIQENLVSGNPWTDNLPRLFDKDKNYNRQHPWPDLIFPNYQDYGYGIFLLDDKSRDYVLKNIQNEKDDFLRAMMWGSLWDSVREGELDPNEYVELAIKHIGVEKDESTIQSIIGRVTTAMNYYMSVPPAVAGGAVTADAKTPPATAGGTDTKTAPATPTTPASQSLDHPSSGRRGAVDLRVRLEDRLIERMQNSSTPGQRITYYRAFLNAASTERARTILKGILKTGKLTPAGKVEPQTEVMLALRTKDRFDIVTRLAILGDSDAAKLLADLEKSETSDEAKRYAYAAKAAFGTREAKERYFNDFLKNKEISESWIEAAFVPFNSIRHAELTQPYLERALAELPNLKRTRKIFFINGWLGAFIGGQRDEKALTMVNKFLADNPDLDKDLRLKILENVDLIERAVKIRGRYTK